jgi:hypothetical protein
MDLAATRILFGFNYDALNKNLDGLTHDDSLIQPAGGGNCLSAKELAAPCRGRTVCETLAILQFHEAYHVGQAGVLRRIAGKQGAI